jgi:adenine/guanine phosphoribosyltransferase-like PRPP-binding protein
MPQIASRATRKLPLGDTAVVSPRELAKRMWQQGLLAKSSDLALQLAADFDAIEVSFRNLGRDNTHFPIETLATLALVLREVAETQRNVRLILPASSRGRRSRLQWVLASLQFAELFTNNDAEWASRVVMEGKLPRIQPDENPVETHYVPLRWFDATWFDHDQGGDPYRIEPALRERAVRPTRDVLVSQGFVEADAIDLFMNVMFLEIGWNAVLHSRQPAGSGRGIFGAQIRHESSLSGANAKGKSLHFFIGDFGTGIPHTLSGYFRRAGQPYLDDGLSMPTAIVRCAIDPDASSRPEFPSAAYEEGHRGLARVAGALRPTGALAASRLSITSAGGALTLDGTPLVVLPKPDDSHTASPAPGVQISAELTLERRAPPRPLAGPSENLPQPVIRVARAGDLTSRSDGWEEFLAPAKQSDFVIVDLGFSDTDVRTIEALCKAAAQRLPTSVVAVWNMRSQWSQLGALTDWARGTKTLLPPLLFVRASGEAALFRTGGISRTAARVLSRLLSPRVPDASETLSTVDVPTDVLVALNEQVNSQYLTEGFSTKGDPSSGFFVGRIHLLSGNVVDRFFALSRNCRDESARRRWASTCVAATLKVAHASGLERSKLLLVGLGLPIGDLLVPAITEHGLNFPAYTIMTFDVPAADDLQPLLKARDGVILISDVVRNGTLLEDTARLVARLGKQVVGVVALVDGRPTGVGRHLDDLPLVKGARLPVQNRSRDDLFGEDYWVDPISQVPTTTPLFSGELDSRIEQTLDVLSTSGAIRCGHLVDGHRHMSTYVDVAELLNGKTEWIRQRVHEECLKRVAERQWRTFNPSVLLYPTGIARIEPVIPTSAAQSVVVYPTAAKAYIPLLTALWQDASPTEVPRAFEPGGRPRCAKSVDLSLTSSGPHPDVLVIDDCLWSGRTAEQLIQLAIDQGARRILVVPLLARIDLEHLQQLERVSVLSAHGEDIQVCYVFPLLLPIPCFSATDCPYEATTRRLSRWADRSSPLGLEEELARASVASHSPIFAPTRPMHFTSAWLRLRAYAELASADQTALELLIRRLKSHSRAERLPLLSLFLEDWQILGRPRLRQAVRPILRVIAGETLALTDASSAERIAASSLLRMLYPEELVKSLPLLQNAVREDTDLFGRVVLHISTLPQHLRTASATTQFLRTVTSDVEWVASLGRRPEAERVVQLIGVCDQLLLSQSSVVTNVGTVRQAASALLDFLKNDPDLNHEVRSRVEVFSGPTWIPRSREVFGSFYERWIDHEERINTFILPHLAVLGPALRLTLSRNTHLATAVSEYFASIESPHNPLRSDLAAFRQGLRILSADPDLTFAQKSVQWAGRRLLERILGLESDLLKALQAMRGSTVGQFVTAVLRDIQTAVPTSAPLHVSAEHGSDVDTERLLFCPTELIKAAYWRIIENLRQYAFRDRFTGQQPQVKVVVSATQTGLDPGVSFLFLNNGASLEPLRPVSNATHRAAADLGRFGAFLHPATPSTEPWSVQQDIGFLLW